MEDLTNLPGLEETVQQDPAEDAYRAHPALSASDLKLMARSPAKFIASLRGEYVRTETSAMAKGTLLHELFLQPASFEEKYAVMPDTVEVPTSAQQKEFARHLADGRTAKEAYGLCYKSAKTEAEIGKMAEALMPYARFLVQAGDRKVVSAAAYSQAQAMAQAMASHPLIETFMETSDQMVTEVPIIAPLPDGLYSNESRQIKGKLDIIAWAATDDEVSVYIVDPKTSSKGMEDAEQTAESFGYFNQLHMYVRLIVTLLNKPWILEDNPFITEEQKPKLNKLIEQTRGKLVRIYTILLFVESDGHQVSCGALEPTPEQMIEAHKTVHARLRQAFRWMDENRLGESATMLYPWDSLSKTEPPKPVYLLDLTKAANE